MANAKNDTLAHTAALIPAFNAGRHLGDVLSRVAAVVPVSRIMVVDDGSSDDTNAVAKARGVIVITHLQNRGKGAAMRSGIQHALEAGFEFVATLDADGQHDPAELSAFAECQERTNADIVVGNRMADRRDMPFDRVFANWATSLFVSLRAHARVPDSQNGYRLMRTAIFEKIRLETNRYEIESEILIKAGRAGARIESVPVRTIYGDEQSGVNPFVDTLRFFRLAWKSFFW